MRNSAISEIWGNSKPKENIFFIFFICLAFLWQDNIRKRVKDV